MNTGIFFILIFIILLFGLMVTQRIIDKIESQEIVKRMLKEVKDVYLKVNLFKEKSILNHIVALFEFTKGYDSMFESEVKSIIYKKGICVSVGTSVLELKLI